VPRGSPREAFGPYLVYERLGEGGMAAVHRAEHSQQAGLGRVVALKRMLPHVAADEEMVRSFVREARLASYLHHANVARTYELGKVGDTLFIAMELVEGRNLREILRLCAERRTRLPVPLTLNILNQICDALDYAHNLRDPQGNPLGIIHRDVSPANVIVAANGLVKLIDFGIAKATANSVQTMSGLVKGKFGYMAPEYLAGQLDARADLFAVGVIAHELLTGRPLFTTGDDIETLHRLRDMPVAPPSRSNPQVPPEIDNVVMTALERDPDRRWQHATALRTAMTTLTKRLDMVVTGREVVQWLEHMGFDSAASPYAADDASPSTGDSVIISIEQPETRMLRGPAITPPAQLPTGTPPKSITAQPNVPTIMLSAWQDNYEAPANTFDGKDAPTHARRTLPMAAQTVAMPGDAPPAAPAPARSSGLRVVLWVLLAAAVVATAIYFLRPLFT